jgi:pimeloyl-ACP methyl ester carboxylesterase
MSDVLLVHGAFVNARCWDGWKSRLEAKGNRVLAPSWPHDDAEPSSLRANPNPALVGIGVGELVDHFSQAAATLSQPILIGHSFGGLIVQRMLSKGVGRCAVAIHPAPPRGVPPNLGLVAANFPVVGQFRFGSKLHTMTKDHWAEKFVNGLSREDADAAWEKHAIPTPGKPFWEALTFSAAVAVDWKSDARKPLLIYGGTDDKTVPCAINRTNFKNYKGNARTEYREWEGRGHWTIALPGWEEVCDAAIAWGEAT